MSTPTSLLTHPPVRTSGVLPAVKTCLLAATAVTNLIGDRVALLHADELKQLAHAQARVVLFARTGPTGSPRRMDGERSFPFYVRVDVGQAYAALQGGGTFDPAALAELVHQSVLTALHGVVPSLPGAAVAFPIVQTRHPQALIDSRDGFLMSLAVYALVLQPAPAA